MCKRTMHKRARIPMFLWERRACANSGAQAVFPRPRKNGLGTRLVRHQQQRSKLVGVAPKLGGVVKNNCPGISCGKVGNYAKRPVHTVLVRASLRKELATLTGSPVLQVLAIVSSCRPWQLH